MSDSIRSTVRHHRPCKSCGNKTYRQCQVCWTCEAKEGGDFLSPSKAPETYLMACAQELLRRHNERHELLVKLGIKAVAS